ncbi:hypothetical protein [Microbacterium trichothecenolyticum]|uniref:Uncharacterized protein n=1 Tax=Microbacterium trichothecenolyticum TaxID=69370 RepID=A0A0M2HDQ8_MICTR|nr:hypothetical protein [Microbacterium trichothecenolyticum]KJL44704.1 hypothetical protein RS82_00661 [Microbacterium trichothecenolyticum]
MFFVRWIPTFLAFPLGELIASALVGTNRDPLGALVTGAVIGGVVGAAQWLALGRLVDWRWAVASLGATAAGAAVCALLLGAIAATIAAGVTGLVTGLPVGAAQAPLLGRGWRIVLVWAASVGAAWGAAGLVSGLDRDPAVFGSNGALVATVVSGIVLRVILAPRLRRPPRDQQESARTIEVAASIIEVRREAGRKDDKDRPGRE